ncbi:relaxase [Proteus mirabilis]|uniref:LPD7 domain-containing protein n=1 Tax=Proteus mirabilis TaxID=584 RepID=UPI0018C820C6|nr:LPD7 domain-containing protein [Proteus mirabilis]EMA4642816.1 relaxase [Proteus mirabilis]MBG5961706.1 relaxase [Proteus mirabilis]MBQ0656109.1 relaxase [Proteus mirabilis]WVJ28461.1 LPD7 domain-containing protein [Proteus mirabilis]HAT5579018.1 relaxase [Proteus mirabilis]
MLSRIGGGNSGIVYYLETGQKQGRELGRDDLDYRLCLDGNIEQLDHVIDSIPDKGQERYLHISLSFHEKHVNEETLKAVCDEYKTLLMNAYDKNEYCFYAEAHIPKVKNVVDEKTGLLIERKPHIHIVIPEKNLLTGNKLNPTGMVDHYVKNLDAIQEHINNKFNLASPKDGVRVSDQNHANVLSRMKGDLFSEAKSEFKKALISDLESENIKSEKDFLSHLSQFGEVKTYNQGKANQYYGVKLPNETKFTRLKSPLFTKQFIETRTIPLIKPTPKQIEKDLSEWCNKTSHEIKHIHPAGEKLRKTYAKLNDNDKAKMLLTLRNQYNERHKIEREPRENIHGQLQRGRNSQRSFTHHSKRTQSRSAPQRLSSLQERNMVYELRGYGQRTTQQLNPILPSNERSAIKNEQSGQYHRGGMRRTSDSGRGRITNAIQQSLIKFENKPSQNDLTLMREIRQTINPERFLSYCVSKYNIDPELHKVTFAKDNSPRFGVDKLNLNASDFLTKHLGLSWEDAKIDLLTINESQQKNEPFLSVLSRTPLNREEAKERTLSRESAKKRLNIFYRDEKKALEIEYKQELKILFSIKNIRKREVERGFLMFNHLKEIETLNKIMREKRNVVNAIHNHWNPNDVEQKKLLNKMLTERGIYMTNKIMNADTDFSFKKTVARKKQFNEFEEQVQNRKKLTDLVAHKKDKEVEYIDQKTKQVVFKDTGSHIEAKNLVSKNEATMMLEYAEKKYGGALRLSGSEAFKETIALAAAEKGMNIILTPEKYHEMMLKEVARLKEVQQQTNQDPKEQQINTITENQDIKLDNQAKPEKDNVVKEVEFLRDWLVNDNIYRNSLMNTKQIEKINSATDQMLSGHINNDKFLTIKAEVNAEIIKERTGIDVPIQDLKNDFNDRLTPEKTETQQISKEIADIQNSEALNPLPNNLTSKQVQEKIQDIPHTIDGKEFNKLIVVPVNKNDGFESHTEYRVAFKHDDKMVTQLKDVTESDLNRMGIDTKNIDMRKVDPVSINVTKLANSQVESPLKHAEKQLNTHIEHMKSKVWSRSEFEELKEQRGKLEANVDKAKAQHAPEQTQQNDHKNVQEQNKGQSM